MPDLDGFSDSDFASTREPLTDEELEFFLPDVEAESQRDLPELQSDSNSVIEPDHPSDAESDDTTSTDSGDAFAQACRDIMERNPDEMLEVDTAASVDMVDYVMSRLSEAEQGLVDYLEKHMLESVVIELLSFHAGKIPIAKRPVAPLMDEDEGTGCLPGFAFPAVADHAHSQQFSYTTRLAPLWNRSPESWLEYQRHIKLFKMQAEHLTRDETKST